MIAYVLRRTGWGIAVVFIVMTLVFNVLFGIGDPAVASLGPNARYEQLQSYRRQHGFDQPVWKQYLSYLGLTKCLRATARAWHEDEARRGHCGLLQGQLGESLRQNEAVGDVIWTRLPRTVLLGVMAMGFELLIGLVIGIVAAVRRNTWWDTSIMAASFLGISAPSFLTGLLFLNWLGFRLGWFPIGGYGVDPLDHVYHGLLPALTLAIIGAATYARIMRSEMIETLRSDYIRTARAKGLGPVRVLFSHAARNALLPIVTLLGLNMSILVSGAVITETIYAWPGIGSLAVESIYNLDVYTVMAVVLISCLAVQVGNLIADLAVAWLDPRVRTT